MKSSVLSTTAQRKPAAEHEKTNSSSANPVSQLQQSIHNSERMTAQRKENSSIQRKGDKEKKKK